MNQHAVLAEKTASTVNKTAIASQTFFISKLPPNFDKLSKAGTYILVMP